MLPTNLAANHEIALLKNVLEPSSSKKRWRKWTLPIKIAANRDIALLKDVLELSSSKKRWRKWMLPTNLAANHEIALLKNILEPSSSKKRWRKWMLSFKVPANRDIPLLKFVFKINWASKDAQNKRLQWKSLTFTKSDFQNAEWNRQFCKFYLCNLDSIGLQTLLITKGVKLKNSVESEFSSAHIIFIPLRAKRVGRCVEVPRSQ